MYAIYTGKISKCAEFGAFVELDGFRGKKEGLVHISQLRASKVMKVEDAVKKGQVCVS